jgi:hypothetical protein
MPKNRYISKNIEGYQRSYPEIGNKPDYNNTREYRIICLLSCMGKIVEKVLATLLSETIDHKLYNGQFRCPKGH